ncbi:MAG: hypothetical protein H6Q41_465 [Deltaproteobacteria bacterium]|nr:hypothetical protein [Deltaproteobacteria bacterium]
MILIGPMMLIRSKIGTLLQKIAEALFVNQSVLTHPPMFCLLDTSKSES